MKHQTIKKIWFALVVVGFVMVTAVTHCALHMPIIEKSISKGDESQ